MEQKSQQAKLNEYISLALDFEDRLSSKVYGDYIKREIWPDTLSDEAFAIIGQEIMQLIDDTENHKKALLRLKKEINT